MNGYHQAEIGSMWTSPDGKSYRLVGKNKSGALMGGPAPTRGSVKVTWEELERWKLWEG